MARYFFHLSFGQRVILDEEGFELPDRTAARHEALAVVRELAKPDVEGGSRRWASWFLEVADENGGFFRTPIGHPALELVKPHAHEARAEEPKLQPAWPAMGQDASAGTRTLELIREMAAHLQRTRQLAKANEQLRREISSLCVAAHGLIKRTDPAHAQSCELIVESRRLRAQSRELLRRIQKEATDTTRP
jgi:hypothetical protein